MAQLKVLIGSGPIALVQKGAGAPLASLVSAAPNSPIGMSFTTPSTAGTALVAVVGTSVGGTGAAGSVASLFPSGWTRLIARAESTNSDLEIWAYLNNPGDISAVSFTAGGQNLWHVSLSEWYGVAAASALETSGSATATSGTTLVPATSGNAVSPGDLVIAAWMQEIAGSTCTFTSPAGFTRLTDDGATNLFQHLDVEYQLNAALGAPLSPTLTSNQTTVSAAGAVIVLKAAPPMTDQTPFLRNGSMTFKRSTFDFALIEGKQRP